jgi:hypothetical protein
MLEHVNLVHKDVLHALMERPVQPVDQISRWLVHLSSC